MKTARRIDEATGCHVAFASNRVGRYRYDRRVVMKMLCFIHSMIILTLISVCYHLTFVPSYFALLAILSDSVKRALKSQAVAFFIFLSIHPGLDVF